MTGIILPNKIITQPRTFREIDYEGLGKGMQILWNPAVGPIDLVTGRVWTPGGNASITGGKYGKSFSFDGTDDYYGYTGYPEITGNIGTFFMWCPVVGAADSFGHVVFGHSSPSIRGHQIYPTRYLAMGSVDSSSGVLESWFNTENRSIIFVSGGSAAAARAYLDGKDSGVRWSNAPGDWGTGNKNFNLGRYVGGTFWDFSGSILIAGYTSAVWGAAEAKSFHRNPWALFKVPKRRLLTTSYSTGPTYFDSDFTHSGSSIFSGESTNIFSIYYNFNGYGSSISESTKIDNRDIQINNSDLTTVNNLVISGTDVNVSGISITSIQNQIIYSVYYTTDGTCVVSFKTDANTTFAQDDFSGITGQSVLEYNTDWFQSAFNVADAQFIITDEQRAIATSSASSTPVFFHRNVPATADYDVSADIFIKSAIETVGVIGRANDGNRSHYMAQLVPTHVKLFKVINWSTTTLIQQIPITLNVGQTYNLKLSMFGDSIKVYIDGVETLSAIDSDITSKGLAGLRIFYNSPISYTTGMHIDNFLAENTNTLNKNIVSINMFPVGTSVTDPKIQSIISNDLSSNGISNFNTEQYSANNVEIASIGLTTEEFLNSIISISNVSSNGLSISSISDIIVKSSDTNIDGIGTQSLNDTIIQNNTFDSSGLSSESINDTIIQNKSFSSNSISSTDIKSVYIHLCDLISNSSSAEELISAIIYNSEINSIGSCIVSFYEGTDGGITFVNVDMIVSGSSIILPTIQKIFNSDISSDSISSINLKDNTISLSSVSSAGTSSNNIDTQKLLLSNIEIMGKSTESIVNNIVLNSKIISSGNTEEIINSISIQSSGIESIGSSISDFLDNFIKSTDFLSNGTCVVSIQQGQDGGKIIINVDFIMDGTSSINNNNGLTLNTNLQSQSTSDFISKFTKIDGQGFTANGYSIIDFIREYLILQTNRKYISVAERRNYVSSVERRNYVSKVKG